jgi:hypothetical protein
MKTLSCDEFMETYGQKNENILDYEDVKDLDLHVVWTLIDADNDAAVESYLSPGFHFVNRLGYIVSKLPWTDEEYNEGLEVLWCEFEDEDGNPEDGDG